MPVEERDEWREMRGKGRDSEVSRRGILAVCRWSIRSTEILLTRQRWGHDFNNFVLEVLDDDLAVFIQHCDAISAKRKKTCN